MTATKIAKTALRLRPTESLPTGIRRIARRQIDTACRELQNEENPRRAVHESRKALKKLRAILQLAAPELGRKRQKQEKQAIRHAARLLAPLRDAEVQTLTLASLIETAKLPAKEFSEVSGILDAEVSRLHRQATRPARRAQEILRVARGRIRRWPLRGLEWESLEHEMRQTYRKGRKALEIFQQKPASEAFHAWRKRVKELWYHLRITQSYLPEEAADWIANVEAIGELAGNANDLAVLRETLSALQPNAQTARLIAEIDQRLPELHSAAAKRGTSFYAEKPRDFAKRLRPSAR